MSHAADAEIAECSDHRTVWCLHTLDIVLQELFAHGSKRSEFQADYSTLPTAEIKNTERCTSTVHSKEWSLLQYTAVDRISQRT
jgi:hypothetical protein